jgi:hypothetical protein
MARVDRRRLGERKSHCSALVIGSARTACCELKVCRSTAMITGPLHNGTAAPVASSNADHQPQSEARKSVYLCPRCNLRVRPLPYASTSTLSRPRTRVAAPPYGL